MYKDSVRNRYLVRDGTSLVNEFQYARLLVNDDSDIDKYHVLSSDETDYYESLFNEHISVDVVDDEPETTSHKHTEEDFDLLVNRLVSSERFQEKNIERLEEELEFFTRTENILFLNRLYDIIERFRKDGVVWGVGRGSSCGSYILYLLYVNDVNPITYDIPFHEMSKEYKSKWE